MSRVTFIVVLLSPGLAALAQPVITAKDYSGFMRGNGYGWPEYAAAPSLEPVSVRNSEAGIVLSWETAAMLQVSHDVTGPWSDVVGAASPHNVLSPSSSMFYRLRGVSAVHSGVGAGCPQQGFDFTGLPQGHWANHPASRTVCGWIVPELLTGFADDGSGDNFVRLVVRSFHVSNNWSWWNGTYASWEDDAVHQNDGWFHFRVRHPNPLGPATQYRLRFEVCFDNPYAFPSAPLQLNRWWADGTWDWESHDDRHVFTPLYRIKSRAGVVGPWQHLGETNTHPTPGCLHDQRHYRCLFEQTLPATAWAEIEVAQNLPYTLDDRARLWEHARTNYLPQHSDLCIRKRHLGYGGLFSPLAEPPEPWEEFNELYAIEVFRQQPGLNGVPDLPNNRIVVLLAGVDYEPAGNFVAEGSLLEILDHWSATDYDYRNLASYVVIPIANPDGYEWGTCHVVPYGNGYADNAIHRGYSFLEPESVMPDGALDPEGRALRDYIRSLTAQGMDGTGGRVVVLLDYQNDLCPHPNRWQQAQGFFPPIYGFIYHRDTAQTSNAVRFLGNLRRELLHPNTARYVRDPASSQGWVKLPYAGYDLPLWILFEFDASALYSHVPIVPGGWQGSFANAVMLPGSQGGPTFYVHGYLDQIGQATAPDGDPAYVFKLFGRDIMDAVRRELLPSQPQP